MRARRSVLDPDSLRPNRDPGSLLERTTAFAIVLALGAPLAGCTAPPGPQVTAAPVAATAHPGGSLFSTISCAQTPLGREWATLQPEAAARFPSLRMTTVEDLHITVVYVGPGWKLEDLDRIRALALVAPREVATFRPEAVQLGRNAHVVVVEMHDAPESWSTAVVAAKAEMNRLGLKKPERYDATFRPHVTLASARNNPPSAAEGAEGAELEELRSWIAGRIAADPTRWTLSIGPGTPVRLWLAGTERPAGAPEYVDVDDRPTRR